MPSGDMPSGAPGATTLFIDHPQSPLEPGDPLRRAGVQYWPYEPALRFELPLLPAPGDFPPRYPDRRGRVDDAASDRQDRDP